MKVLLKLDGWIIHPKCGVFDLWTTFPKAVRRRQSRNKLKKTNDRHSNPGFLRDKLQPKSRAPSENRDSIFEMVPDYRRNDDWMPPYHVRGRLIKSALAEKAHLLTDTNESSEPVIVLS
jgi:hypothetical protein